MGNWAKLVATFFGVGLSPKAPGTMGTLATIPLAIFLLWAGPFYMMGFIVLFLPLAIYAADIHQKNLSIEDPQEIVIDEVFGFLITMTWLPITWQSVAAGFCLFRVLDIWKPFPIGYLDRKVPGGFGVMADDIAAGLIANVLLQIVYTKTMWLGVQIL
jgi:phosphatidylglycerophosphatase A